MVADLVSISEAARQLNLSVSMIRKLCQQGTLRYEATPYGKAILASSLDEERQRRVDEGRL